VKTSYKLFIPALLLILCLHTTAASNQILRDSTAIKLIRQSIDCIYNSRFSEAEVIFARINKLYPGHPVSYLLKGMEIYWQNYPLLPASPDRKSFEEALHKCIEMSDDKKKQAEEPEYLLANLCARGLLLLFYTDNDLSFEVFPLIGRTYQGIRSSFNYTDVCADFYYFTGVYNYYREVYPETYPVYKPLTIIIPKGDKLEGIKQLRQAAGHAVVLRAEALIFLSQIFLEFENNTQQSLFYSMTLHENYPDNPSYEEEYIKNLLLSKEYDKAESQLLAHEANLKNSFFKAEFSIMNGILKEKKYHDFKSASELYLAGVKALSLFGNYGKEFSAFAYFGLSRISESAGDKYNTKQYRKLGDNLSDFKKINFD
jgi:hypothetical protein